MTNHLLSWMLPCLLAINVLAFAAWLMPAGMRVVLRGSRSRSAAAPETAEEPATAPEGLEAWIDEVERDEAGDDTELFWREWAATGGNVPRAADSGRAAS